MQVFERNNFKFLNKMDKNSYALGMSIAHNMMSSGIKSVEFDDFVAGVKAVLTGSEPAVSFQEAGQLLDKYFAELEAERKAAFLGDMLELGEDSQALHKEVVDKLLSMDLSLVCLVGKEFAKVCDGVEAVKCFDSSDALAQWLKDNPVAGTTVLVKGSRGTRMEKVIPEL